VIHSNSLESWRTLDATSRRQAILEVYRHSPRPLTDRQVRDELHLQDMNQVRPRITELVKGHWLREVGKVRDEYSRKTVRLVTVAGRVQRRLFS
jgi:hypothetical protein